MVVLKSYDGRGRDVAWVVLGGTLILVSGVGLGAGHLGIYVGDRHIVHAAAAGLVGVVVDLDELMGVATSLAHNEIDGVAGVDGAQTVYDDVLHVSAVDSLDGDGRAEGVEDGVVDDAYVLETAYRCGAKLDAAGARASLVVAYGDVLAEALGIVRLEADGVIGGVDVAVLD